MSKIRNNILLLVVTVALLTIVQPVTTHLNVFITQSEVMKLLGLNSELFYVRDGVVNTYAMNFVVMVPAKISNLEFSWQSLTKNPLSYAMTITYDSKDALYEPQVNISSRGVIPTVVQTFRIKLPCTGVKSAEIEVQIQFNISTQNKMYNETWLNFRRNKICLKGVMTPPRNDSETFYVAVGCAITMISVVVVITSAVYVNNKKVRHQDSLHKSYTSAAFGSNQNVFIRLDSVGHPASVGSGSYATIASIQKYPVSSRRSPSPYATTHILFADNAGQMYVKPEYCPSRVSYYASSQLTHLSQATLHDPRISDPADRLRSLFVQRKTINFSMLLQEGTFGQIYRGTFTNSDIEEEVIVKTVSDVASKFQITVFLAEGTMMYGLSHKNILSILATNTDNPKQPLLVYPYFNKGNLKRFLLNCRQRGEQYTLLTQDLIDMAIQTILGIMYLHSQHIYHKDIATRNCVVDEKLRVKVTDNALSRDLFPSDYHCLGDNENRPVKWLALESLSHKQFTGASDVWSFGVLLWELTTLAQQPYPEIDPFEIASYLIDGYRLAQPINCPDELFTVMACCWLAIPDERPTFVQLLAFLQDFYTTLGRFI